MRKKITILLVDDEPSLVQLLGYRLESKGYKVIAACDGTEALKLAQKKRPDLIILDIMLPNLNGYEICMILKEDDKTRDIPVIMLTAKTHPTDKIEGLKSGAVFYITKPYEAYDVLNKIEIALEMKKGRKK